MELLFHVHRTAVHNQLGLHRLVEAVVEADVEVMLLDRKRAAVDLQLRVRVAARGHADRRVGRGIDGRPRRRVVPLADHELAAPDGHVDRRVRHAVAVRETCVLRPAVPVVRLIVVVAEREAALALDRERSRTALHEASAVIRDHRRAARHGQVVLDLQE